MLIRRPGQFRLHRRRSAGRHALHRVPAGASRAHSLIEDIDKDTVDFQENYDDSTESRTEGAAGALPQSAGQWRRRHRGWHGDQHSAAQSGEVIDACMAIIDNPSMT
jgi:DNA gyrase subunit A